MISALRHPVYLLLNKDREKDFKEPRQKEKVEYTSLKLGQYDVKVLEFGEPRSDSMSVAVVETHGKI